jgi:hypothetical protein
MEHGRTIKKFLISQSLKKGQFIFILQVIGIMSVVIIGIHLLIFGDP